MSYSLEFERDFLAYVEEWQSDADAPIDPAPVMFPETPSMIWPAACSTQAGCEAMWRRLERHVEKCEVCGWIAVDSDIADCKSVRLTADGFARIEWHRERQLPSRIRRGLLHVVEHAMGSIVAPVVVSILTVVALKMLEVPG